MRGKKLLALLLCLVTVIQMVPAVFAEEQNAAEPESFSVYAPDEFELIVGTDGEVTVSPENPAIYNGMKTKSAAVTEIQITAKDGWTLVPFGTDFSDGETARQIGVNLNGEEIDPSGTLDLSERPWVVPADGRLPLDLSVKIPGGLAKEDVKGVLTIRYTFDWAEDTDGDHLYTLTFADGEHGTVNDKTPVKTDESGKVPELPSVTPEDGYEFDKWVDENGNEVKPGDVLDRDITITPTFIPVIPKASFTVEYDNGLMLPDSNNTATFKWENVPEDFELAEVKSSDPSIADVEEIFDSAEKSQLVGVKARKRGVAKFTGVSTTGEKADFDVLVSELNGEERPSASVENGSDVKPGDVIGPGDITVTIPTVTPDGGTDTVTVTPTDVSDGEIKDGKNVVSATVDVNGVDMTVYITIDTTEQTGPSDPDDHTHTITVNEGRSGHVASTEPLKTDKDGRVPELPAVTPDAGYVFDKWLDEAGDEVNTGDTIDEDITITPTFERDENYKVYTITIDPDGDHGHSDSSDPLKTDESGKVPDLPTATPDTGYVFDKWVDDSADEVKPDDILDRDITITPIFKLDNTYTLTPIDGDHGTVPDKTPIKTGENGVVQNNLPNATPDPGYKFQKWVDADIGKDIKPGDVLNKNIEIKPVFTEDKVYTLTPVDNDHGTVNDKTPVKTNADGVVQNNFPDVTPNSGYSFNKWVDENGQEVKPGDILDRNITITPFFESKEQDVGFKITPTDGDHGVVADKTAIWTDAEGVVPNKLPNPTPDHGYAFSEWVDESGKTISPNMIISKDIIITPVFVEKKYTVVFDVRFTNINGKNLPTNAYIQTWENNDYQNRQEHTFNKKSDYRTLLTVTANGNLSFESQSIYYPSPSGTLEPYLVPYIVYLVCEDGSQKLLYATGAMYKRSVSYTFNADEIENGEKLYVYIVYERLFNNHDNNPQGVYTLFVSEGIYGTQPTYPKYIIYTDENGVVPDAFPEVIPDKGYAFLGWVDEDGKEIKPGDIIKKNKHLIPVYKKKIDNWELIPVNGEHGTVPDKTRIPTDAGGMIPDNLPKVLPDANYEFVKWVGEKGETIIPGNIITEDITITPVFQRIKGTFTMTPVDGDFGTVDDKTPIKTDAEDVVQDNFPSVTPKYGYLLEKWIDTETGNEVRPGDVLTKDITIMPTFVWDSTKPFLIEFQTASYYEISDTTPIKATMDNKVPMELMPEVSPIVSHYFDGSWVNVETGETVDENTVLTSSITVKPQINCLFTAKNGAVTGFSDYAQDKDVSDITIPCNIMGQSVSKIASGAFAAYAKHDPNLKSGEIKHVTMQKGFTAIGERSFGGYVNASMGIESISLPDGLKTIGGSAFYTCNITSIEIPDTVTSIGDAAFWGNKNLKSVKFGSNLRSLGYRTFILCTSLRSVDLPASLREIGTGCFESSGLESITVPNGCTVGENAFIACKNLKTATLGEGTTYLYCTFQQCPNLKTVYLPRSVNSIDENAFYFCPNLAYIYIKGAKNRVSGAPWGSSKTNPTVIWTN